MIVRISQSIWLSLCLALSIGSCITTTIDGFVVTPSTLSSTLPSTSLPSSSLNRLRIQHSRLFAELPDISKMKASEMKKELESYGISTKSLFEKKEFQEALTKARAEGKTPIIDDAAAATATEQASEEPTNGEPTATSTTSTTTVNGESPNGAASNDSNTDSKSNGSDDESREGRYQKALEKAKTMKVGELRKELTNRGISTKSFFEKSEFEKAYAEAIADNKAAASGSAQQQQSQGRRKQQQQQQKPEEPMDPSYRDVTMQKIDRRQLIGATVIDTSAR